MRNILLTILFSLFLAGISFSEIVFTEDFEEETLDSLAERYTDTDNLDGMSFSDDIPLLSKGNQSLMMTSCMVQNYGGSLFKAFVLEFDTLYVRYYVKFAVTQHPIHHFVWFGGMKPLLRWPNPHAGEKPEGNDRFSTELVPLPNFRSVWTPYTYWMNMRRVVSPYYFGNIFISDPPKELVCGEWMCIEQMIMLNTPADSSNGEQAFWINGELILHLGKGFPNGFWTWNQFNVFKDSTSFEGFQWRNDEELKINYLWIQYYMQEGERGQRDTCWFDEIVVSTEYIGPLVEENRIEDEVVFPENNDLDVYPNPFNSTVSIDYNISKSENISLLIYDINGREIAVIEDGLKFAGQHFAHYSNSDLSSGLYILKLTSARQTIMRKVLLIK
ncbi:T9SS type A sorting domain-containing protein [bacterium]|nr:T9SS type A sorting domain-containing protein [bacterium]